MRRESKVAAEILKKEFLLLLSAEIPYTFIFPTLIRARRVVLRTRRRGYATTKELLTLVRMREFFEGTL